MDEAANPSHSLRHCEHNRLSFLPIRGLGPAPTLTRWRPRVLLRSLAARAAHAVELVRVVARHKLLGAKDTLVECKGYKIVPPCVVPVSPEETSLDKVFSGLVLPKASPLEQTSKFPYTRQTTPAYWFYAQARARKIVC